MADSSSFHWSLGADHLLNTSSRVNLAAGSRWGIRALGLFLALALMACTGLQKPSDVSLADLQEELTHIKSSIAATDERLAGLTIAKSTDEATVNEQLTELDKRLKQLPRRMQSLCQQREQAAVAQCEPQSTQVVIKADDKMVLGELETLWVDPPGVHITARVDTGASSSSLHAANLVEFERDGDDWVRFEWRLKDRELTIERPVLRFVKVVQQADPKGTRRPVVSLRMRIGDLADSFEFTLADRAHLEYQVILGRNFLTDVALVDVSRQFVQGKYEPENPSDTGQ